MKRGITLIELLLSLTIVVVVTMASTRAYISSLNYETRLREGRDAMAARGRFEDTLTDLIHHAWISSSTTNRNSFFIGGSPTIIQTTAGAGTTSGATTTTPSVSAAAGGTASGGGTGAYGTPNTMVFTAAGLSPSGAFMASNNDFETNNQSFGPQGGVTEVELSQNPVGAGGQGKSGLFLRTQTPADNDPTQGGDEQNLAPDVTQIGFEFFDGQNWDQSWDNRQQTPAPGRLPAAVRITYRFKNDSEDHIFVVRIPASDATYLNPVTVTG